MKWEAISYETPGYYKKIYSVAEEAFPPNLENTFLLILNVLTTHEVIIE